MLLKPIENTRNFNLKSIKATKQLQSIYKIDYNNEKLAIELEKLAQIRKLPLSKMLFKGDVIKCKITSDGTKKYYDEKRRLISIKFPNKTQKTYREDGGLKSELSPGGNYREYYDNDVLKCRSFSNGVCEKQYMNGKLAFRRHSDGSETGWYENGTKAFEVLSDGTYRRWYMNGTLESEILPDGTYSKIKNYELKQKIIKAESEKNKMYKRKFL